MNPFHVELPHLVQLHTLRGREVLFNLHKLFITRPQKNTFFFLFPFRIHRVQVVIIYSPIFFLNKNSL